MKRSAKRLDWTTAEADERTGWKRLREFLVERALEHDVPSVLFRLAAQWLASDEVRMVRPGVVALMREIATARGDADGELFRLVGPILAANPALSATGFPVGSAGLKRFRWELTAFRRVRMGNVVGLWASLLIRWLLEFVAE